MYWGIQEQYDYITMKYPNLSSEMAVAKITWEIVFINMMFWAKRNDVPLVSKSRAFARQHMKEVLRCGDINEVRKIQIGLFAYCLRLYKIMYFGYKKRKGIS